MLNNKAKYVVDKFLNDNIFPQILDTDNLLGVVLYGSSATGYFDKNSDIDLLILLNYADHSVRGVKYVDEIKIEYFIKPIGKFLSEGNEFAKNNCPSHVALNQNAEILYGQKDFVENILNAESEFYNKNHIIPNYDFDKKIVQIENRISSLKNIYKRDGKEFEMVYFNILEMIRDVHSAHSGEAAIPFVKAYRIYNDLNYYNKYVGEKAENFKPDKYFVKLYSKCVEHTDNRKEMLKRIIELFNYEKKFYTINTNDYEIKFL